MVEDVIITAQNAWETAVSQLKGSMDRQTFNTLLGSTELISYENNTYIIGTRNAFTRDWLEQRLTETIEKMLSGLHAEAQTVRFVVSGSQAAASLTSEPRIKIEVQSVSQAAPRENQVYSRYTFDNYVVGPGNNLACAACRAVAEMPSTSYNPLFIYSGVGLGKTHLLHAIGNKLAGSGKNVIYVSSEEFTNDFITSIQRHENPAFREKYRSADVLLIDDIQFIIGKESTQEEFFHTFNRLYEMNKQIVITSDRAPKSMSTLDERMRSRFEWGLTVDIQPPDLETRIAILASKAQQAGKKISMDILELIARQIPNNVRELEGALNRVLAVSDLCGKTLDKDLVLMSLTDMMPVQPQVQTNDVVSVVSGIFGVPAEKIMSRERTRDVALSRQVVMYLMREEGNISLPQIGQALGGRDHTTVIHACEKVSNLLESDNHFRRQVLQAKEKLYGINNFTTCTAC